MSKLEVQVERLDQIVREKQTALLRVQQELTHSNYSDAVKLEDLYYNKLVPEYNEAQLEFLRVLNEWIEETSKSKRG